MGILAWIVVGLIAGWLASLVMGGGFGLLGDILLGIVGALIGGFVLSLLGLGGAVTGINLPSILVAFVGAVIVLFIARAVRGRRRYL